MGNEAIVLERQPAADFGIAAAFENAAVQEQLEQIGGYAIAHASGETVHIEDFDDFKRKIGECKGVNANEMSEDALQGLFELSAKPMLLTSASSLETTNRDKHTANSQNNGNRQRVSSGRETSKDTRLPAVDVDNKGFAHELLQRLDDDTQAKIAQANQKEPESMASAVRLHEAGAVKRARDRNENMHHLNDLAVAAQEANQNDKPNRIRKTENKESVLRTKETAKKQSSALTVLRARKPRVSRENIPTASKPIEESHERSIEDSEAQREHEVLLELPAVVQPENDSYIYWLETSLYTGDAELGDTSVGRTTDEEFFAFLESEFEASMTRFDDETIEVFQRLLILQSQSEITLVSTLDDGPAESDRQLHMDIAEMSVAEVVPEIEMLFGIELNVESPHSVIDIKERITRQDQALDLTILQYATVLAEAAEQDAGELGEAAITELVEVISDVESAIEETFRAAINSNTQPRITLEITEKLLLMMRKMGYEDPDEMLINFLQKYDLLTLHHSLVLLRKLHDAGDLQRQTLSRTARTDDIDDDTVRICKFIGGFVLLVFGRKQPVVIR